MPDNVTTPTRLLRPPVEDQDLHLAEDTKNAAYASRVPDLLFLSANFSSESLDLQPNSPTTPAKTPNGFTLSALQAPYHTRRYSNNSGTPSLANSPVGQPSYLHHQRAGSNTGARPRPRSMLGSETANYAIWEDDKPPAIDNSARNRHSAYFASKMSLLAPPAESRAGRSRSGSPVRATSPIRRANMSPYRSRASSPSKEPFNFKLQDILTTHSNGLNSSLVVKPAHRKGHRYKHSSVSMNLFQEPVPIADANLQQNLIPDSYPIPNFQELLTSAGRAQKSKLVLSLAHFAVSVLVFMVGVKCHQPTFSTLAHLVFYDSLGSLVVACVEIASNFEVWNKSSIAYPFGLGRLEVLTGFALSASLVMVGCDLVSHFVEELVISYVDSSEESIEHGAHHIHGSDASVNWILYQAILFIVIAITFITSKFIFEGGNISDMMSDTDMISVSKKLTKSKAGGMLSDQKQEDAQLMPLVKSLLTVLVKNPIRLLTLGYSVFLVCLPVIPGSLTESIGFDINELSTLVVAATLCYAGWNLVKTLGGILLISFPYSDYDYNVLRAKITDNIHNLPSFKTTYSIDSLFLTKVNYQLYIANTGITMKGGSADDESRLLFEVNRIFERSVKEFDADSIVETTISVSRV